MRMKTELPRILIIDDLFGRQIKDQPNRDRANLCGMYGLEDVTGDESVSTGEEVVDPVAQVVFFRGQRPLCADIGDTVENDLDATTAFVRKGWQVAPGEDRWALVLLDLCFYTGQVTPASHQGVAGMPEGRPQDDDARTYFGLRILERLHAEFPELPVVILSSKKRDDVSESFTAHGALGFIPRTDAASPELLRSFLWRHGLVGDTTGTIAGNSLALLLALRAARRVATDRRNVLIRGERGTGKELLARYINQCAASEGRKRPLVAVDSGALTPSLYYSELFGHTKGSFTGALSKHQGLVAKADGGDLFFDEIGNMPMDVQAGLLRVLETRVVMPLGAAVGREADVRFLAATNVDIEENAATGVGFRGDLLDRLREGGTIVLPPLRERCEDIPRLAERLVRQAEAENAGAMRRKISAETMAMLIAQPWDGNIRELRSCIFKAVNDHPDVEYLVPDHLELAGSKPDKVDNQSYMRQSRQPGDGSHQLSAGGFARFSDLVGILERFEVRPDDSMDWAGRWAQFQSANARVMMGLLHAALYATRRLTPQHPEGEIKIHPAIKLLTGDTTLTASKAADLIKRIFAGAPEAVCHESLQDPILKAAHDIALRLRPKSAKRSKSK